MDATRFFDSIRDSLFGGSLTQDKVNGCNSVLNTAWPDDFNAYALATVFHETGQKMQPVREIGQGRGRAYGVPGRHGGQVAYGRGYVQLTWDVNYERADKELGLNGALLANYDLALDPGIAAQILRRGMEEGWFTGHRLGQYFAAGVCAPVDARHIINGQDQAIQIAGYFRKFQEALEC